MGIGILGCCVSREAFQHRGGEESWRLPRPDPYAARSSLVSLMSPPLPVPPGLLRSVETPWERMWLKRDYTRSFWRKLAQEAPACLVLDFVDERFDLYGAQTPEGEAYKLAVREIAVWARRRRPLSRLARLLRRRRTGGAPPDRGGLPAIGYRLIPRESQEAWDLWTAAADGFMARMRREFPRVRLLLHRAPLTDRFADGGTIDMTTNRHGWSGSGDLVSGFGPLLRRYYDYLTDRHPGLETLEVPESEHLLRRNHPWNEAPFHYQEGYHRYLAEELRRRLALSPVPRPKRRRRLRVTVPRPST